MQPSPRILGAVAAGLITAVVSGSVLGTVPPMRHSRVADFLPEAGGFQAGPSQSAVDLPDQYPIVTPEGRFEVAQLSERGLFRTMRYARSYAYAEPADGALAAGYAEEPAPEDAAQPAVAEPAEGVIAIADAEPAPEAADAAAAPELAAAGPRIIDVAAELAERR